MKDESRQPTIAAVGSTSADKVQHFGSAFTDKAHETHGLTVTGVANHRQLQAKAD